MIREFGRSQPFAPYLLLWQAGGARDRCRTIWACVSF